MGDPMRMVIAFELMACMNFSLCWQTSAPPRKPLAPKSFDMPYRSIMRDGSQPASSLTSSERMDVKGNALGRSAAAEVASDG